MFRKSDLSTGPIGLSVVPLKKKMFAKSHTLREAGGVLYITRKHQTQTGCWRDNGGIQICGPGVSNHDAIRYEAVGCECPVLSSRLDGHD